MQPVIRIVAKVTFLNVVDGEDNASRFNRHGDSGKQKKPLDEGLLLFGVEGGI